MKRGTEAFETVHLGVVPSSPTIDLFNLVFERSERSVRSNEER